MHHTTEIRRQPSASIDTGHCAPIERELRINVVREAVSSFVRFVGNGFKNIGRRRVPDLARAYFDAYEAEVEAGRLVHRLWVTLPRWARDDNQTAEAKAERNRSGYTDAERQYDEAQKHTMDVLRLISETRPNAT